MEISTNFFNRLLDGVWGNWMGGGPQGGNKELL
jgi:hypothetical protein